jgi:hypothetical protein
MEISKQNNTRKIYHKPVIQTVTLDFEISLSLQSIPPFGPDEYSSMIRQWKKTNDDIV